jgi:hypothetical protein
MLTYLTAALALITGLMLFVAPGQMAPVFAWNVTPLMAMTIGGWCLGNAWLAFWVARRWDWTVIRTSIIYLWLFGVLESAVVIAFRDRLALGHPVAWVYLAMLAANLLAAITGILSWWRVRPAVRPPTRRLGGGLVILSWVFLGIVGFLGAYGLFAQPGTLGTNGGIFPEVMTPFTLRAFAAFYLSLALATVSLWRSGNLDEGLFHSMAAYALIITISAAIVAYAPLFDISEAPGRLIYIGAYVGVGVVTALLLYRNRGLLKQILLGA